MKLLPEIRQRFSIPIPLLLSNNSENIKLEIKPYLQPFEKELAIRELSALLNKNDKIAENSGLYVVESKLSDQYLRDHLTYWQRVGSSYLEPTLQGSLEFTQCGYSKIGQAKNLHRARRLRYGPHDLHEYRGKFFPQLVRSLINISGAKVGATVLDPMCGSGTTLCEARAAGRMAIGADLNPLSVLISTVKSALPTENPDNFLSTTNRYLKGFSFAKPSTNKMWNDSDFEYLSRWFDPAALEDISSILLNISAIRKPLYKSFFKVCLSNIIRSVSWQKQTDLRVRKEVLPYEPKSAIALFRNEVEGQIDRIFPYLCVLPPQENHVHADIRLENSVNIAQVYNEYIGEVDVLITSPPYATALPYLDTDRLSLIALGLLPRSKHKEIEAQMIGTREVSELRRQREWSSYLARRNELPASISSMIEDISKVNHRDGIGFRRRNLPTLLGMYFINMLDAMRSAHSMMKPDSNAYYVVGNNSTVVDGEKIEIPTDNFLFEIADLAGWNCKEMIPMELLSSRDIFRENRGSTESILCLTA